MKATYASISIFLVLASVICADTLTLKDGTVLSNCYVRDEGIHFSLWRSFEDVGNIPEQIPASKVKSFSLDRTDPRWDRQPELPDLSVTFIEMNPKLPGLHGNVSYDKLSTPTLQPTAEPLKDIGDQAAMHPEEVVADMKFQYEPGQVITLTAHVRNIGFTPSKPFRYVWKFDGKPVSKGEYSESLDEMEEALFPYQFTWKEGFHHITFEVITDQDEIAIVNNTATDPLWALPFVFYADNGRIAAWHSIRTAAGTFSFEDHYRYHVDLMNNLFKHSVYPSAPSGIIARVRLDRVVYTDNIKELQDRRSSDGIIYDQGAWTWVDKEDETRRFKPPELKWRNSTEWSLPHELGHQLGLIDWYNFDFNGSTNHVMTDTGENVTHFMRHPQTMMHWHGPQPFSEVDAGYLNQTWNKPRGYFADHVFAIPRTNYIRIVDINGRPVQNAKVEIYQRATLIDKDKDPVTVNGVTWCHVIEDGRFDPVLDTTPVISGTTDRDGIMLLPNRPVKEVRTLNGFHRKPNPLGNVNVVGQRGLLMVKVTAYDRPVYFWLENYDFNEAWFRGKKDSSTFVLKTPYGSEGSPLPPVNVAVQKEGTAATVTWQAPAVENERNFLEKVIGYTVYRRISNDGLNDKPWFPVATVGPETLSVTVDLEQYPQDTYWFSKVNRFAVSSLGESGMQSELVETVLKK